MFFPERIASIGPTDRVLEVGPGGNAHPRADVLLERAFDSADEAEAQRGYAPPLDTRKQVVFFDGDRFPFKDREFDYVICSHVLEHVPDPQRFVAELGRVAPRGYLEFPTVYYDYIYDIPKHITMLLYRPAEHAIYFMPKEQTGLAYAKDIQRFFFATTFKGYVSLIDDLRDFMFQGFEWSTPPAVKRATALGALLYDLDTVEIPEFRPRSPTPFHRRLRRKLGQLARLPMKALR